MKKLLTGLSAFLLFSPLHVFAAESGLSDTALGNALPIWSCIPFAGMLLSIAIFPLIKEECIKMVRNIMEYWKAEAARIEQEQIL